MATANPNNTRKLKVVIEADGSDLNKTLSDSQGEIKKTSADTTKLSAAMTAMAAATERAAQKQARLTESFKSAGIEKQTQRIAALDRQIRAMKSHIGIDVEIREDRKRGFASLIGKAQEAFSGLPSMLQGSLSKGGPYVAAGLVLAIASAAPAIGAAFSAALTAGPALALLAFGIKKAMQDPKVKAAFDPIGKLWDGILTKFAQPFMRPLILAAGTFAKLLKDIGPTVSNLGVLLAPLVTTFANGLAGLVKNALPGFVSLIKAGAPILKQIGEFLPQIGDAFRIFGTEVSKSSGSTEVFVKDVLVLLKNSIIAAGHVIRWLADRYRDWHNTMAFVIASVKAGWQGLVSAWNSTVARVSAGVQRVRDTFQTMRDRVTSVINGIKSGFATGVSAIEKVWNRLQDITKKPINFFIDPVYARIRDVWNTVTSKLGFGSALPNIQRFAAGGVVQGRGNRDNQLSLLKPGEGVLTTDEMRALGGPRGFQAFRSGIGDGFGGWFRDLVNKGKNLVQGLAAPVVSKLVNGLRPLLSGLRGPGLGDVLHGGANRALDAIVALVKRKDAEVPALGSGIGYRAMQAAISRVFKGLQMVSGFRPGSRTVTGNLSYHAMGRAVDYPPVRALAEWINKGFKSMTRELITPWQDLNLHNGRPHRYTGAVWNTHNFAGGNAHVHWAMDSASVVQPGWFAGYNGTGKPETLVNADLMKPAEVHHHYEIHNHGVGNMSEQDVKKIRREVIRLGNRNGGRTGLPAT